MKGLLLGLILLLIRKSTGVSHFRSTIASGSPDQQHFTVIAQLPKEGLVQCSASVVDDWLDSSIATAEKANAFKYDGVSKTCTVGKIPMEMGELTEGPTVTDTTNQETIYTLQGCLANSSSALDPSTTWEYWKLLEDTQVSGLVTPTTYYAPDLTSWYTGAWNFERPFINGMYAFKKDHSGYNGGKLYNLADSKTFRSFSLFVWFYSLAGVGGYQHLASFPLNGNWNAGWCVYTSATVFPKSLHLWLSGGSAIADSDAFIQADEWVHLGTVYDYEQGTVTFYLNGIPVGATLTGFGQWESTGQLPIIGQYSGTYCNCDLAEMEIYDRALTAEEAKATNERISGDGCPK